MKKVFLSAILSLTVTFVFAGNYIINGVSRNIDTIEYKVVGPGTTYCHGFLTDGPEHFHTLTIDLHNPYNNIETFLGKDCVEGTELVTSACNRYTSEGHDAYCGINSDFFLISSGTERPLGLPRGGSIQNGEMQVAPDGSGWWGLASIDTNKVPLINYMYFTGTVTLENGTSYTFKRTNVPSASYNLTFYNKYAGAVTRRYENDPGFDTVPRTEVVVVPVSGDRWGVNKDTRVVVRRIVHNIDGGEPIANDESVLSGVRDAATFLSSLAVGDELTVHMEMRTADGQYPGIDQLVGGNAVLVKDGVLTSRNTTDSYNSVVYPRTAIAYSADGRWLYLFVADGKYVGGSVGITCTDMSGILVSMGAAFVAGLDGGGSSEMVVHHNIVNNPADGTERSVGNGWMVVNSAPTDSVIAQIRFYDYKIEVPNFTQYTPVIMGYNQYGTLICNDVKGFTLSVDDAAAGSCSGSVFTAGANAVNSTLTATYNGVSCSMPIRILSSDISFRLDSVIVDQDVNYSVEVSTVTNDKEYFVNPASMSFIIEDNDIAEVDQYGRLNGKANGRTMLYFDENGNRDSLLVISEINEHKMVATDFTDASQKWTLKTSSAAWNTNWNSEKPNRLELNYSIARAPYIKIIGELRLFSLPDSMKFNFQTSMSFTNIYFGFKVPTYSQNRMVNFAEVADINKPISLTILPEDIVPDASDLIYYPLILQNINFYINTDSTAAGNHYIEMKSLDLYYGEEIITSVPFSQMENIFLYPNPAKDVLYVHTSDTEGVVEIFDLEGRRVYSAPIAGETTEINISALNRGVYLVRTAKGSAKLIIR